MSAIDKGTAGAPRDGQSLGQLWMVDLIKALASQLIVLHHFVSYGPMVKAVFAYAPHLIDWLYNDALMAVQAFLVVGGFLSARSLAPRARRYSFHPTVRTMARLAWHRYVRLARPYLPALLLAIVFAAIARVLMADVDTPAPPSLKQVLLHVLLIQDIAGVDSLSTGFWYLAIDLQLYCLLLLLLWAAHRLSTALGIRLHAVGPMLVIGAAALSLLWINRDGSLEIWGIYFFGAYALGMMVQWTSAARAKWPWLVLLLFVYLLAFAVEWRMRMVVSITTAALLAFGLNSNWRPGPGVRHILAWFGGISYSVFLIHYPIVLLVGTLFVKIWPANAPMFLVGFLVSWLLSLAAANALHRHAEKAPRLNSAPA